MEKMSLNYPKHKHPHGIENTTENPQRIWVCEECGHAFTDADIREDATKNQWGHNCKYNSRKSDYRCESHLEPYIPSLSDIEVKI